MGRTGRGNEAQVNVIRMGKIAGWVLLAVVAAGCLVGLLLQWAARREPAIVTGGVINDVGGRPEKAYSAPEVDGSLFEREELLYYRFSWNGIPGAAFQIRMCTELADGVKSIVIKFSGETLHTIDWAWRYRMEGVAYVDPQTLLPWRSTRLSVKPGKQKKTVMVFDRGKRLAHIVSSRLHKGTSSSTTLGFSQGLDMGSALLFARCFDWSSGLTRRMEVVDGKSVYVLEMTPVGEGRVTVGAGAYEAVEVDVKLHKVTGDPEERRESREKYRKVRVWFSRDERRLPVLLESEVFVGTVRAELMKVGSSEPPAGADGGLHHGSCGAVGMRAVKQAVTMGPVFR